MSYVRFDTKRITISEHYPKCNYLRDFIVLIPALRNEQCMNGRSRLLRLFCVRKQLPAVKRLFSRGEYKCR